MGEILKELNLADDKQHDVDEQLAMKTIERSEMKPLPLGIILQQLADADPPIPLRERKLGIIKNDKLCHIIGFRYDYEADTIVLHAEALSPSKPEVAKPSIPLCKDCKWITHYVRGNRASEPHCTHPSVILLHDAVKGADPRPCRLERAAYGPGANIAGCMHQGVLFEQKEEKGEE